MEIKLNFDENQILEKVKSTNGIETSLLNDVQWEIRRQAIKQIVDGIKGELTDTDYYGREKDYFKTEIINQVYSAIEEKIQNLISNKFSDKSVEYLISSKIDKIFNEFIEKRVSEKLQQAKADLQFYSEREMREQRESEQDSIEAEMKGAYESGLKDGYNHKGL
jgi:hypothetical protein